MTHHKIKCWPKYFNATTSGQKPFDVRLNDRDYQAGDIVTLEEWDPDTKEYTGRAVTKTIAYVLFAERAVDGLISSQTCVLGFGVSPGLGVSPGPGG